MMRAALGVGAAALLPVARSTAIAAWSIFRT
jgi:hypothetical protein